MIILNSFLTNPDENKNKNTNLVDSKIEKS